MQSLMLDELKIASVDDDEERVVIILKIDDPVRFDDSTVPNEVSSAQLVVDLMDRRVLVQIKKRWLSVIVNSSGKKSLPLMTTNAVF